MTETAPQTTRSAWADRLRALGNIPPVLHIVWESGPSVVTWNLILRVLVSFLPICLGKVAQYIVDGVNHVISYHHPLAPRFWWLVALELSLAVLAGFLTRLIDYCDSLLADRYTNHVSVQVMRHAAALDVTAYEDPVFYDRLERARVQATDRLGMIQAMGRLLQQIVTTMTFSAALLYYSPWLLLLLVAGIIPAFLGESHFAFLGYAKNFRQTPVRRQMDYLRQVGGSKEAAKELKLFGLSDYLTNRFAQLSQGIYQENVALSRRRLVVGGVLSVIGTLGYYGAYAFVIWRAIHGAYSIGTLTFLTGAIVQASSNIQQVFSTVSSIADQALFLTDLIAFFAMKPLVESKPNAIRIPRPVRRGFEFQNVSFSYPGSQRRILSNFNFHLATGRTHRPHWRKRPGQDHHRQAHHPPLRPHRGPHPARRRRPPRILH